MIEYYYEVYEDTGESQNILASRLNLKNALLLVDALFTEYYAEPELSFGIRRVFYEEQDPFFE